MDATAIARLVLVSTVAEGTWEALKMTWQKGKLNLNRIGPLTMGVAFALGTQTDFFSMAGIPFEVPYAGSILTGVLLSRGANLTHDLLKRVETMNYRTNPALN